MKSRLFGGLCCAAFLATTFTYLSQPSNQLVQEDSAIIPSDRKVVESNQLKSWFWEEKEATKLVVVTSAKCPPCRRLKLYTIPALLAEGYDVTAIDVKDWDGPKVTSVPALFYMDEDDNILRKDVGFKTPTQIKKYLNK